MTYLSQHAPQVEIPPKGCYVQGCEEQFSPDSSYHFSVGISHYSSSKGVSYIQVHEDMLCCTARHAAQAAHNRLDAHVNMPHGVFNEQSLNPSRQFPSSIVRGLAEYSEITREGGFSTLPKQDAVTGKPLGDDVYVVHVDFYPGIGCYQSVLQKNDQYRCGNLSAYDLGCATLQDALTLAHGIVDEIFELVTGEKLVPDEDGDNTEELPVVEGKKKGK